jgi:hypothetical protein
MPHLNIYTKKPYTIVLLQKLIVAQVVKKFPEFYGAQYWFLGSHDLVAGLYPEREHHFEVLYVRQDFTAKMHNIPHDTQLSMQQIHLRTVRLNRQLKAKSQESDMAEILKPHDCKPSRVACCSVWHVSGCAALVYILPIISQHVTFQRSRTIRSSPSP